MRRLILAATLVVLLAVSAAAQAKQPACGMDEQFTYVYEWSDVVSNQGGYHLGPYSLDGTAGEFNFQGANLLVVHRFHPNRHEIEVKGLVASISHHDVSSKPVVGGIETTKQKSYRLWPIKLQCRELVEAELQRQGRLKKWVDIDIHFAK